MKKYYITTPDHLNYIDKKNYHQDVYSMKKKKRKKEFVIKKTIITITMNIDLIS